MSKVNMAGYIVSCAGTAVWLYGYLMAGTPPLVNWTAVAPAWVAGWLPNKESEIGMAVVLVSMALAYWPARRS